MHKCWLFLALWALCAPGAYAAKSADAPVSDATIHELMSVTNMRAVLDQMAGQFDPMMKSMMQQASAGQTMNAEQQSILEEMRSKMVNTMKEELNWSALEPVFVRIYRTTFTQSEVEGMLKFYKSPAGKALIAKLPVVMKSSMAVMQEQMKELIPKLQQIGREGAEKLQAARTAEPPTESSAEPAKP